MSVELIGRVLNHSTATGSTKLVLLGIAWHTKEQETGCWPSQDMLGMYANLSNRQVRRCLNELEAIGELTVISNGAWQRGSSSQHNLYHITLDCPDYCDRSFQHGFLGSVSPDIYDHVPGHL